jgi:hypothetical protein
MSKNFGIQQLADITTASILHDKSTIIFILESIVKFDDEVIFYPCHHLPLS